MQNRPGLDAIAYRVGTHRQFLDAMTARLSATDGLPALTTRQPDDPALALLDAAASLADVLTFYQERIANEGYLRTATEDGSIRELGRLVGYAPRPGVAATTFLSYTLDDDVRALLPRGSRVQSVPGPGEQAQTFETVEELDARGEWNTLPVRTTRDRNAAILDDAAKLSTPTGPPPSIALAGTSTGLNPGDPLLADFGETQVLFRVIEVESDAAADRTRVAVLPWTPPGPNGLSPAIVLAAVERFSDLVAAGVDPTRITAKNVLAVLATLRGTATGGATPEALTTVIADEVLPSLRAELAALRAPTGPLRAWLTTMIARMRELTDPVVAAREATSLLQQGGESPGTTTIGAALGGLAKPASVPPSSAQNRPPDLATDLAPTSDALPDLLLSLRPDLASTLYSAWQGVPATPAGTLRCYALRKRASAFGHAARPEVITDDENGKIVEEREWALFRASGGPPELFTVTVALPLTGTLVGGGGIPEGEVPPQDPAQIEITIGEVTADPRSVTPAELLAGVPVAVPAAKETVLVQLLRPPDGPTARLTIEFANRRITVETTLDFGVDPPEVAVTASSLGSDPVDLTYALGFGEGGLEFFGSRASELRFTVAGRHTGAGRTASEEPSVVSLDTTYPTLTPGGWIVLDRPDAVLLRRIRAVREASRSDYGITGKSTFVGIDAPWLDLEDDTFAVIRGTAVYADSELLTLAETPLDPVTEAVCGAEIELDDLYDGLRPGRWLVVSGERTDITGDAGVAVPGVPATELVMLGGVRQEFHQEEPGARTRTTLLLAEELAYCYRRDTITLLGNVVKATQGESTTEMLGSGDGTASHQVFTLVHHPLTFVSAPTDSGVESTLSVRVDGVRWRELPDFIDAGPTARAFVTATGEQTDVVFGDGREGARLPTGSENVAADYRFGMGAAGNVAAGTITVASTRPQGVLEVVNPLRATGGADPEPGAETRRRIPLGVTALDRVVSVDDYRDFAVTFAGIGKAAVAELAQGRSRIVHLTVAGVDDAPLEGSDVVANLRAALIRFGDPDQPFLIEVRQLLALVVAAKVAVLPDRRWDDVQPAIRTALIDCFGFARRDLAQDVTAGEVTAAIQAVPGVDFVDLDKLDTISEATVAALLTDPKAGGLDPGLRKRVFVRPARRVGAEIVPAELALLRPGVPALLSLTEMPP
ncbi:putative baseplate assembly protein [Actinomycetospora chibensis]|uniref:Baseplate assembly protein n=1 Tax=Actinomycetospora chibensis TaxID=663606 RepID=A0ABV9RPK9_9PSEU|nr:putative baseplate assembly protein [Actinomycetospora chibensis]MDD7926956.1 putative baseplate assembly protein [Actinomycetospora chibensis]